MSDKMNRIQGLVLSLIVVAMASVFALQFGGNQASGCASGGAMPYAAKVHGVNVGEGEFRAAYMLHGFDRKTAEEAHALKAREETLNGLIERELLAHRGRELGFNVSEEEIWEHVIKTGRIFNTQTVEAMGGGRHEVFIRNEDEEFNREDTTEFIQQAMRRSLREFTETQRAEMIAERVRDLVRASVQVSPEEVYNAWVREHASARFKYVRFGASAYAASIPTDAASIQAWATANQAKVDAEYTRRKSEFTNLPKQVHARHILIKADSSDAAAKAVARTKAEGLLARAKGGEDFAALARDNSEDEGSASKGGDLGWNPKGRMVKPFDDAQFALGAGQISDLVESEFGFHIIKVDAVREGDVPEAEAKLEVAGALYRDSRASELAKVAADQSQADLAGGMTPDQLNAKLTGIPEGVEAPEGAEPQGPRVEETTIGVGELALPGDNGTLTRAVFALTMASPLAAAPIQVGKDWVVVRLEEKTEAKEADFPEEDRRRIHRALVDEKQREAILVYVRQLRAEADKSGDVKINDKILEYPNAAGEDDEEPAAGDEETKAKSKSAKAPPSSAPTP